MCGSAERSPGKRCPSWKRNAACRLPHSRAVCVSVASLLSCLYQLKAENRTLEERIATMTARRDRLLAVNARLSVPLASPGGSTHAQDCDSRPQSLDNGLMDDGPARHGKSPRSCAAPAPNFASLRVSRLCCCCWLCCSHRRIPDGSLIEMCKIG